MARRLILVLSSLVLLASACSDPDPVYDPSAVEALIAETVAGEQIVEVGCVGLDTIDPAVGGSVSCRGVLDDDLVDLGVAIVPSAPVGGLELGVDVEILTDLFDVAAAATAGAERLESELGGSPVIACPLDVVVSIPGRRIECWVTADGGTAGPVDRPVTIIVAGDDGSFELDLFD
ncbi:MAG: hypothetical protein AAF081_07955 [Actinomycetota bacterium]